MYFYHRQRRADQNRLMGYPPDRWRPWMPFPSYEVCIRNAMYQALGWGWEIELETGTRVTRATKEVGPVTKLVKVRPKLMKEITAEVSGSRDPDMPGHILVPLSRQHHTLPKVKDVPPETFYRYNERKRRVECMVTMMPGGLLVAWDTCSVCSMHVRTCRCVAVSPSRDIIHFYELATGEPFQKQSYETRTPVFERKTLPSKSGKPLPVRSALTKEPPKLVKAPRNGTPVELTKGTDLSKFDKVAEEQAGKALSKLAKLVGTSNPKPPLVKRARLTKG